MLSRTMNIFLLSGSRQLLFWVQYDQTLIYKSLYYSLQQQTIYSHQLIRIILGHLSLCSSDSLEQYSCQINNTWLIWNQTTVSLYVSKQINLFLSWGDKFLYLLFFRDIGKMSLMKISTSSLQLLYTKINSSDPRSQEKLKCLRTNKNTC